MQDAFENPVSPESDILSYAPENFDWPRCLDADTFIHAHVNEFLRRHCFAANLARRMNQETSTRFIDWVDHIVLPSSSTSIPAIETFGFVPDIHTKAPDKLTPYWHPHADFPQILIDTHALHSSVAIQVESLDDFCHAFGISAQEVNGESDAAYRTYSMDEGTNCLRIVERHGYRGFVPQKACIPEVLHRAKEQWKNRMYDPTTAEESLTVIQRTLCLARALTDAIGPERAADIVLAIERDKWMERNAAGRCQKSRLDTLGLGWGGIRDHHTFRSSRENFLGLVQIFLALGFKKRERYYAGDAHGWGAQVMEHPITRDVLFLDVDLFPDEAGIDFSIEPLAERNQYHTVGRWCALHGDSILQSGMHHLEAQFDFAALKKDLASRGIGTMEKFSNFPELQQAFTTGESWHVHPDRLASALQKGAIDRATFDHIREQGYAIGSHLENLERNQGYKGFNKSGVDAVLAAVDPQRIAIKRDIATALSTQS